MNSPGDPSVGSIPAAFVVQHPRARRILIVDDELDLWWRAAIDQLACEGHEVDTAPDAEAAWRTLKAKRYDLLITDNKMPRLWGLELIQKVRSAQMSLRVILASNLLPLDELNRNKQLKIDVILEKRVTGAKVLDSIKRVLQG